MSISQDLANTLHSIVDALPWREESSRERHHAVITESAAPVVETEGTEPAND